MRAEKRLWVYSGLSVPRGRGLVRELTSKRGGAAEAPERLLLAGSSAASGLVPVLRRLARDDGFVLDVDLYGDVDDLPVWLATGRLAALMASYQPRVLLLAVRPYKQAVKEVGLLARSTQARPIWLFSPGKCTLERPSVAMCAEWAARIWNKIKED